MGFHQRFVVSPFAVVVSAVLLFPVGLLVWDPDGGGLTTSVLGWHPLLPVIWLSGVGLLLQTWLWSIRPALRSVRVDDEGLWVDGELVVEPHHVDAFGVLAPARRGAAFGSERLPTRDGAGLLERVGAHFSPDGWVRRHGLPTGGSVAIPGAQDVGGRSGLDRVIVVLDRHVDRHVRDGWGIATWRARELLEALARMAPDAERLGAADGRPG